MGLFRILVQENAESDIFGNPYKSGSGHIFSRIWQMAMRLQCVQLITGKTYAADLSGGVAAISVNITQMK